MNDFNKNARCMCPRYREILIRNILRPFGRTIYEYQFNVNIKMREIVPGLCFVLVYYGISHRKHFHVDNTIT